MSIDWGKQRERERGRETSRGKEGQRVTKKDSVGKCQKRQTHIRRLSKADICSSGGVVSDNDKLQVV